MNDNNLNKLITTLIISIFLVFATFITVFHRTYYNRFNDVNIEYSNSTEGKTLKQLIEEDKERSEYIKKLLDDYVRD